MPLPILSDQDFGGGRRIINLPLAVAAGQPLVYGQAGGPVYRSGRDISLAVNQLPPTTATNTGGTLRAWPFLIEAPLSIAAARFEVTAAVAGGNFRAGLYVDSNGYPAELVQGSDVGAISSVALGVQVSAYVSAITLAPGLYWQALNFSASTTLRAITPGAISSVLGWNPAGGVGNYTTLSIALVYGTLPGTFPIGATPFANTAAPLGMYRVV